MEFEVQVAQPKRDPQRQVVSCRKGGSWRLVWESGSLAESLSRQAVVRRAEVCTQHGEPPHLGSTWEKQPDVEGGADTGWRKLGGWGATHLKGGV